jgi:hypothetical protein
MLKNCPTLFRWCRPPQSVHNASRMNASVRIKAKQVVFHGRGTAFLVGHQSARLKRPKGYIRALISTGYLFRRRTDYAAAMWKARGDRQAFRAEPRNAGI